MVGSKAFFFEKKKALLPDVQPNRHRLSDLNTTTPRPAGPDAPQSEAELDESLLGLRSAKGAAMTLGAQGVRFVLQFGSQILLAHLLAPADFGVMAMAVPILSLVQIFNELGLSQATIQLKTVSQAQLSVMFWTNVAVSCALAGALAGCARLIALAYGQPQVAPVCMALSALLVLSGLSAQQIALLNRRMGFAALAGIDIACNAGAVVAGMGAAAAGLGVWSLVLMQAANSGVILVLSWTFSPWRPSLPRWHPGARALLAFGGHVTFYNIINYFCNNLDAVLVGRLAGSVQLGFYDRAVRLVATPFWQISLPAGRVALPLLSRLNGQDGAYREAFASMLQGLMLALSPLLIWIAATARVSVPLVLGAHWSPSGPMVSWLALATLLSPLSLASYWLFVSQGRTGEQLPYATAKMVLTLLAVLLGMQGGALGVTRMLALLSLPIDGVVLWGALRTGPVRLRHAAYDLLPVAAGVAASAAALKLFGHLHAEADVAAGLAARLLVSYAAGLAVFLAFPTRIRTHVRLLSLAALSKALAPREKR